MATELRVLRSSTPGKVPQPGQMKPGQFAQNTHDGSLYTVKVNGQIVQIASDAAHRRALAAILSINGVAPGPDGNITLTVPAVPTKVSQLQNDSGFITAAAIPSNVSAYNNDAGYITASAIPRNVSAFNNDAQYVKKDELPSVPSKTSDLQNDSGFITARDIPDPPSVPTKVSELQNDAGYLTEDDLPDPPDIPTKVSDFQNDAGYLTRETVGVRKVIELPDNGSTKREGGLYDLTVQSQVDRLSMPYIPGKCIFEFPNAQQNRKTLWAISPRRVTRPGTRILPVSGIVTFTESTPALIAGCLFDYVETTANGITRFRFIGDYPMYVHMKGTLRMQKKMANQAQTDWHLSDATLRLNPVNSSNVPQEARNNVSGGQYIAYSPCTLAPTGMQPQHALGGGIEFNDPSYRWRQINEDTHKDGDDWDQSLINYLDGVYIQGGAIHPEDGESESEDQEDPEIVEGLPGALTAKFDVTSILPGRYVRVYVDNPELEAQGIRAASTRFRVLFKDVDGNTMPRDDRQYLSATADARVIRVPEGAKDCYLYFKRPIDTVSRVRIAKVVSTISQVTFDPGYGIWGEYIFDIDRGITLYPNTVYDFNLVMGSKSGFLSGVFENNILRYMGGSISFDFNAYPYLKKKGILL